MTHVDDEPGRPDADGPGLLDRLWQAWTGDAGSGCADPAAQDGPQDGPPDGHGAGDDGDGDGVDHGDGDGADVREIMVSEIAEHGAVDAATDAAWDTFHAGTELNWG